MGREQLREGHKRKEQIKFKKFILIRTHFEKALVMFELTQHYRQAFCWNLWNSTS